MARYSRDTTTERSLQHSVHDGAAYAVMTGAGETYFTAFAVLLKTNAAQMSFFVAVPALLASVAQVLAVWLSRRVGRRKPVILAGAALQAFMWLPIILLPPFAGEHGMLVLTICAVLYFASVNLAAPGWNSLMGDLVPERRRGRFFANRTRLMSVTSFIALLVAGGILHIFAERGHDYGGFVAIFGIALLARLYSVYHLTRMVEPHTPPPSPLPPTAQSLAPSHTTAFVWFTVMVACMHCAVAIASPFFTLYMLRDLEFSYLQFTVITAMSVLVQFLTLNTWGRLGDIFGNRVILATTAAVLPILPVLWLVSSDFWYLLALQILGGASWAGFSLSSANLLYDTVPAAKRTAYSAAHSVITNTAVFVGALSGGAIAAAAPHAIDVLGHSFDWSSGLWAVFVCSTLLRTIVAITFTPRLREVRDVRPVSASGLLFRVLRYNALAGLVFDVMAPRRRRATGPSRTHKS